MTEPGKICLQNIEDLSVLTMIPDNSKFNLWRMKKQFLTLLVLISTVYSQIKIDGGIKHIILTICNMQSIINIRICNNRGKEAWHHQGFWSRIQSFCGSKNDWTNGIPWKSVQIEQWKPRLWNLSERWFKEFHNLLLCKWWIKEGNNNSIWF